MCAWCCCEVGGGEIAETEDEEGQVEGHRSIFLRDSSGLQFTKTVHEPPEGDRFAIDNNDSDNTRRVNWYHPGSNE